MSRHKALDAVAEAAAQLGDIAKFKAAVAKKLEEEAAFASHVQALFPHGEPRAAKNQDARPGALVSRADYCQQHGFASRTVQRWYKLLDDAVLEAETAKRVESVLRLVLGESAAAGSEHERT
jgi:hypothetical protein